MDGVGNNWREWTSPDGARNGSDGNSHYIFQNNQWHAIGPVESSGSSILLNQQSLSSLPQTGHMARY